MGSCVSRDSDTSMKVHIPSHQSKSQKLIVPSPVNHNDVTVNGQDHSVKSQRSLPHFRDDGSKDEAFFDSQPWLESDCEDDFLSVNGDFTPSRGTTPVHHNFSSGNPTVIKLLPVGGTTDPVPEPSPKKRLSELFKESLRHHQDGDEGDVSENGASNTYRKEEVSAQSCFPGLRLSRSFSGRKNKMSLPNGTS